MSQRKNSQADIQIIVDRIKFMDRTFRLLEKGDGFLLQMEYFEADITKPGSEAVKQGTRKYYISPYMTESEIVETAWLCVQRSMLHVAAEHFTYENRRVYSPHFNVIDRQQMCDGECYDARKDL